MLIAVGEVVVVELLRPLEPEAVPVPDDLTPTVMVHVPPWLTAIALSRVMTLAPSTAVNAPAVPPAEQLVAAAMLESSVNPAARVS